MTLQPDPVPPHIGALPDPAPHRPAQDDTDETYFEGSPQLRGEGKAVFTATLIAVVVIGLPIALHALFTVQVPALVYLITVLIGLVVLMIPWMRAKSVSYKITNYRINVRHGLLSKTIDTVELWHVEEIEFHQSLWSRIVGVGTIEIISHNPTIPKLLIRSIPQGEKVFERLQQRIISVKRQSGVMKLDTGN